MAANKEKNIHKKYIVEVKSNPEFCGIDVAGIQFAHGKAEIENEWIAEWYRTHEGYEVKEKEEVQE